MNASLGSPRRRRLPFLPPLAAAVTGVLAAEFLPLSSALWLGLAAAGGIWFFSTRSLIAFLGFCAALFATLHLWQSRESPAAVLAARIGVASPLVTASGIVEGEARVFGNKSGFTIQVQHLQLNDTRITAPLYLEIEWPAPAPSHGDAVEVTGIFQNLPPPRNPGQFDRAAWMARRGVYSRIQVSHANDAKILATDQGNPILAAALQARDWMRRTLTHGLDDPLAANLLVGMTLGDTTSMPEAVRENFRGTGTFHLFAVSGLHVGILAVLLWTVFNLLRIPRSWAAGLIILILCFYALMTGLKPSNTRATLMAIIVLVGMMGRRQPVLFNNLLAAAFLILLAQTNQLFNPGFQLSFSVVAAILIFEPRLRRAFASPFQNDPFLPPQFLTSLQRHGQNTGQKLAALAAVSAAAWIGSLPLTLAYFHLVSFSAIPANLFAVPLAFAIMAVALLSLGAAGLSVTLSLIFNQTNWLLARLLIGGISVLASLPGSFLYLKTPQIPNPQAEVVVFDFGSGGAAWLSVGGRSWLFDTGPAYRHDTVLLPFLHAQGLRTLDGLLITHGDAAHIGGATTVLTTFPPRQIVDSVLDDRSSHRHRFQHTLAQLEIPKSLYRTGDVLTLSPTASLHVLHPPAGLSHRTADEKVLIVRVDIEGLRILFLSDAGLATERWLLAHQRAELACDILIRGAPNAGPSAGSDFLAATHPKVVITTAARFPSSENLSPELISHLQATGVVLFRQDQTGAVTIKVSSTSWQVSAFLTGQQFIHLRDISPPTSASSIP